jgi:hypothetical protein
MLLRLVGGGEHGALLGERDLASRLDTEKALEGVDAGAGSLPLLGAIPLEFGLQSLGHAPAMGKAELGKHCAGGREAEVLDQILP